ncbi:uncharacterized protein LOC117104520, partial [Anneissia japonica]|uniref:uncharacterized protein LOC117104520 n=1 Tax=Anneissia japonica TaxID=1529436 RepID=UPI0014257183
EVQCDAGKYREGATNKCKKCQICGHRAYYAGDQFEDECRSSESCPQWCGVYSFRPVPGEKPVDCAQVPTTPQPTTQHTTYRYTTGREGSTTDFIATNATVTNPPPSYNQTNVAVISVVVLLGVAVLFVCLGFCLRKRSHRQRSHSNSCSLFVLLRRRFCRLRVQYRVKLRTVMVYPGSWHLRLEQESRENVWLRHRFWLTVANSQTNETVKETEWENIDEKMKIDLPVPSSGLFYAKLGVSDMEIISNVSWIQKLEITVPNQPCNCTLDDLKNTEFSPNSIYSRLCTDLNKSPPSIQKIGQAMERTPRVIESLLSEQTPFVALLDNAMTECDDVSVSHIIMGLSSGKITDKEQRVLSYLSDWHRCVMCQHIKAYNTGVPLPTVAPEINVVV